MTTPTDRYRAGCNWNTAAGRCGRHLPNHHLKTKEQGQSA